MKDEYGEGCASRGADEKDLKSQTANLRFAAATCENGSQVLARACNLRRGLIRQWIHNRNSRNRAGEDQCI
jgi:hypothetical protein